MPEIYDDLFNEVNTAAETPAATEPQELSKDEYAAKKQAERDSLSELANKTQSEVTSDGDKFKQFLNTLARFERYSAQNNLLIFAQKPNATRLGDYEHWQEAGTPVTQKGAISIFDGSKEYQRGDGSTGVSMNVKKVFDISLTAAKNTPIPKSPDLRDLLKALMESRPCPIKPVDFVPDGAGAHYDEQRDIIEVQRNLDGDSLYRVMAQEIAYATLDHQNTDTLLCKDKGFSAYAASYAICAKHGIDTKGYDFSEVKDYFSGRDGKDIRGEIKQIRDTVNDIATRMARSLNPPEKKAPNKEARG